MSGPTPRTRRVPDFALMVAVVAVALLVGFVVLAVVPRPVPASKPAAADPATARPAVTSPPAPTVTSTPFATGASTPWAGPECSPDADLPHRLLVPPAGATTVVLPQLSGLTDVEKAATLWQPHSSTSMQAQLSGHGFQACDYQYWESQVGVTTVLLRFDTVQHATDVGAYAVADLSGRQGHGSGAFAWSATGSRWIEFDFGGIPQLVGVFTRGVYLAFIIVGPAGGDGPRSLLFTLAQQQYDLLADQ